jgi:ArsR family transcriptional regulator
MEIRSTELFGALSHETRLRCLVLLLRHEELCVCQLTEAIGAAQPHISRHLAHLREVGLVVDRREGLWIHYRVNPGIPAWVEGVLRETLRGVAHLGPFADDDRTLARMPARPGTARCA